MFTQINSLNDSQVHQLHSLYQKEWWTDTRTLPQVRAMLEHTDLVIALVDGNENLVAFSRLLTDFLFHATLYDVIVAEPHRGTGAGRELMHCVHTHPQLQEVNVIWLCCLEEMIPFYRRFAYSEELDGLFWMKRVRPNLEETS